MDVIEKLLKSGGQNVKILRVEIKNVGLKNPKISGLRSY